MKSNIITLISPEQVTDDCNKIGIPDWYRSIENNGPLVVSINETQRIMDTIGVTKDDVPIEVMHYGLQIELEHGCKNPDTNITNNHPLSTALIVMAHHNESHLYYPRLAVMEKELKLHNSIYHMGEAIKDYNITGIRDAVSDFRKIDEEEISLNATEIAIAKLI